MFKLLHLLRSEYIYLFIFATLLGFLSSIQLSFSIYTNTVNCTIGCSHVRDSVWFGVPVAYLGAIHYVWLGFLGYLQYKKWIPSFVKLLLYLQASIGFGVSLSLGYKMVSNGLNCANCWMSFAASMILVVALVVKKW